MRGPKSGKSSPKFLHNFIFTSMTVSMFCFCHSQCQTKVEQDVDYSD
jgi:hypothetical protein